MKAPIGSIIIRRSSVTLGAYLEKGENRPNELYRLRTDRITDRACRSRKGEQRVDVRLEEVSPSSLFIGPGPKRRKTWCDACFVDCKAFLLPVSLSEWFSLSPNARWDVYLRYRDENVSPEKSLAEHLGPDAIRDVQGSESAEIEAEAGAGAGVPAAPDAPIETEVQPVEVQADESKEEIVTTSFNPSMEVSPEDLLKHIKDFGSRLDAFRHELDWLWNICEKSEAAPPSPVLDALAPSKSSSPLPEPSTEEASSQYASSIIADVITRLTEPTTATSKTASKEEEEEEEEKKEEEVATALSVEPATATVTQTPPKPYDDWPLSNVIRVQSDPSSWWIYDMRRIIECGREDLHEIAAWMEVAAFCVQTSSYDSFKMPSTVQYWYTELLKEGTTEGTFFRVFLPFLQRNEQFLRDFATRHLPPETLQNLTSHIRNGAGLRSGFKELVKA